MKYRFMILSTVLMALSGLAHAYPKHDPNVYDGGNLWEITFYNDDSTIHTQWATQRICFLKYTSPGAGQTHIKGAWYATTFPGAGGRWQQEGDSVYMNGNIWQGFGNHTINFDIYSDGPVIYKKDVLDNLGAGHAAEWFDSPFVNAFANLVIKRVGKCREIDPKEIDDLAIEPRQLEDGSEARYLSQPGQLPLKEANQYEKLDDK